MKKKLILLFIVLSAGSVFAQTKPTPIEINASKIIKLANSVTNLRNYYLDYIGGFKSILETADSNIKRYNENHSASIYFINCNNIVSPNNDLKKDYDTQAKQSVTFAEKDSLLAAMKNAFNATYTLEIACDALSDYFSRKEFTTDDDFSKYETLVANFKTNANLFVNAWLQSSEIANNVGNEAEIMLLRKSKIADFVIPMKQDLFDINKILNQLNREDVDTDSIQKELTELLDRVLKNKDITTKDASKLSDVYYKEVYVTFYRKLTTCIEGATKLIKRIAVDEIDDNSLNSLAASIYSSYDDAVNNYNTFISQ